MGRHTAHDENEVRKASFWSDGGADIVFADGTVMLFRDEMDTFAVGREGESVELMITALCLSKHQAKVRRALQLYNRSVGTRPKLVEGLTADDDVVHVWRQRSPIESLILSASCECTSFNRATGTFVLWCALHRVRLELCLHSLFFTVVWPALVVSSDNSTHIFVSPVDDAGNVTNYLATQRASRFVELHQRFPVESPPEQWEIMLALALALCRRYVGVDSSSAAACAVRDGETQAPEHAGDDSQPALLRSLPDDFLHEHRDALTRLLSCEGEAPATISLTLPTTLDAVRPGGNMHFAELQHSDIPIMVAATHTHSATCMGRLHPRTSSRGPAPWVTHSYDATLGWAAASPRLPASVVRAEIPEDSSCIVAERNGDAFAICHVKPVQRSDNSITTSITASNECGSTVSARVSVYHQAAFEGPVTVPRVLPGEQSLTRGRYLPEAVAKCITVAKVNEARLGEAAASCSAPELSSCHPQAPTSAILLSSRIDNVGTFTALANGITRAAFDDRTIITLTPDEGDSESGLVCTIIDAEAAAVQHIRVVQVTPQHKAHPYLNYVLAFRRFSRLSTEAQRSLQFELGGGREYTNTAAEKSATQPTLHHHPSTVASASDSDICSDAQPSEIRRISGGTSRVGGTIEELLQRTRRVLSESAESSQRSAVLLQQRL